MKVVCVFLLLLGVWSVVNDAATSQKNTLYGTNSVWRAKLPANAPVSPHSAAYAQELLRQINITGYMWINTDQYSVPMYYVPSTQPAKTVTIKSGDAYFQSWANIAPLPDDAIPASGTDSSLLLYQQSTDRIWEFWQLHKNTTADTWSASWGGFMPNVSSNPGFFINPHPTWGVAATSIGLGGGVMSIADAQAGVFPYALRLTLQDYAQGFFVPPARRTDGDGKSVVPQGTRYRLPATFNVSTITNSFARVVATALRDYGMITCDTSGGVTLYAEDPSQYGSNQWPTIFGNQYPSNVMKYIPWNLMQVVDPSWQPYNSYSQWYQAGTVKGPSSFTVATSTPVFADALASGWLDYSWATVNKANTSPVHSGSYSISATLSGSTALYLHFANIDTVKYNAIQMWVVAPTSAVVQQLMFSIIQLVGSDGKPIMGGSSRLGSYFNDGMPTSWTQITIPFSDMGFGNTVYGNSGNVAVTGFWIQAQFTVSGSAVLYVDDISLVSLSYN